MEGRVVGECGRGLLVLAAAHREDTPDDARKLADRIVGLRVFSDAEGKMNLALGDLQPPGAVLAVSNFTLYGDAAKSRRPSFVLAAPYETGQALFNQFVAYLRASNLDVSTGSFGAHMEVDLVNEGPVTIILDTRT